MSKLTCLLITIVVFLTFSKVSSASDEFICSEVFLGMEEEKLVEILEKYNIKYEIIDFERTNNLIEKIPERAEYRFLSFPVKVFSGSSGDGESGVLYEFGISREKTVSMMYCTYYVAI